MNVAFSCYAYWILAHAVLLFISDCVACEPHQRALCHKYFIKSPLLLSSDTVIMVMRCLYTVLSGKLQDCIHLRCCEPKFLLMSIHNCVYKTSTEQVHCISLVPRHQSLADLDYKLGLIYS